MKVRLSQLVSHKDGLYALDDRGCLWLRDGLKWDQIDTPETNRSPVVEKRETKLQLKPSSLYTEPKGKDAKSITLPPSGKGVTTSGNDAGIA